MRKHTFKKPETRSDAWQEWEFTGKKPEFLVTRREALQLLGGGIVVLLAGRDLLAGGRRGGGELPTDFNAFLRVGEDGQVTCFVGKIEMGQGVITSLAQELADELDVPLESVHMVMGDTDLCPWDMGTFGSMSTRFLGPPLRAAGAEARGVLLALAAERLGRPVGELAVENGAVFVRADKGKRVSYAELAQGKKIARHLTPAPPVKTAEAFKVIGTATLRRDARMKVTGEAKYSADLRPAGMLYAKVLRPPAHGATMTSVDTSAVKEVPGAQVVQDGDLVAVLHAHPEGAERALGKVKAQFTTPPPKVDDKTIFQHLLTVASQPEDVAHGGDLKQGEARSAQKVEATYLNSYVAHAPIEPHAAVAQMEGTRVTVWASTQNPFGAKGEVAEALGCPADQVRIISPFVGGGFGGKTRNLQVVAAARLAKLTGKPVQVAYTRSEEFFEDSFRPAAVVTIRSGLTSAGEISFWDYDVYFAGSRGAEQFYDIQDHSTAAHGGGWGGEPEVHPFATGAWRAPGNNTNTFARESHIDSLAAKAGADPVAFRLKHLRDEKMRAVLNAAVRAFGWTSAKLGPGRGCGVSLGIDAGTYVATMAEAEVDTNTGAVQVKRVAAAQDMGLVINPEGARIQMEGCITMGLGYALTEEIHFRSGDILDRSFGGYQLPRFSWLPQIETVFVENKKDAPQGGGEPTIINMGGVVANAICAATGARVLQLPMTPERVKAAIAKA